MSKYAIKYGENARYVSGINARFVICQFTDYASAKRFASEAAAKKFIATYGDAGFGLVAAKCAVVSVEA